MNETNGNASTIISDQVDQQQSDSTSDKSSNDKPLTDQGINERIVQKIRFCIDEGKLVSTDVDSRVCEQLRSFPSDNNSIDSVFDEYLNSDLTGVVNKSAFLCNLIKQWKLRNPQALLPTEQKVTEDLLENSTKTKPGPDEIKMKQILDRTGYSMEITAGQRKYGGPPPDGPAQPAHNSEVFIGKLPREIFEDELIPLCEEAGKIWDLRLMIDPSSGFNKGYCFVTYCNPGDSVKTVEKLNGYAIRPGKIIKANGSVANRRLFIGNIPKTKSKEEIQSELVKVVEGVETVIVYTPADEADRKKNRGFCFVDFDTHKNASVAKRKLSTGRARIFNRDIAVDWADPDDEPDDTTMSQVKVLYVRNLTSEVTENDVKDCFLPYGTIERVRKLRDYAFVHFDKRDDAVNAMRALNGQVLGRNPMGISLAKPMSEKRKQAQMKREQRKQFDDHPSDHRGDMFNGPPPPPPVIHPPPTGRGGGSMHYPMDDFHSIDNFRSFAGEGHMRGNPRAAGAMSNRGNRGGRGNANRYDGATRTGNSNNRGNFHSNHNNHQRVGGPPTHYNNNHNGGSYQNHSMANRYNNSDPFGAFSGPPPPPLHPPPTNQLNNNSYNDAMNMNSNHFRGGPSNFGGMKRGGNPIDDLHMTKRSRIDAGSWKMTNTDGTNSNHHGSSQTHSGGNWYQDQGYNTSQPQSNYSWN